MNSAISGSEGIFPLHPLGYIRHWLVVGPCETLYRGQPASEDILRDKALDHQLVQPPASAFPNSPGPFGNPWRFYYPGENFFVEHSTFYRSLTVIDSYAFTEIESVQNGDRIARLWVAGAADLWVNGAHVIRFGVARYMYPDHQSVTLPLQKGTNRICVRLQCFGVRDTRILFGLQLMDQTGLSVRVPGCELIAKAAGWLDGVRADGCTTLCSSSPAPLEATIGIPGEPVHIWRARESSVNLGSARPFQLQVTVSPDGQSLHRSLEIPKNRVRLEEPDIPDLRAARLDFIGDISIDATANQKTCRLLARRLRGRIASADTSDFSASTASVESREDCADFIMATLLRIELLGLATRDESTEIRRLALGFRYWSDEPGNDAMCFNSENHSLLFHGCQMLAGKLFPSDIFSNSNRSGIKQAGIGIARIHQWLDKIEKRGFGEFNSSTYLPITIAALLNLIDFSGDSEIAGRSSTLIDGIYANLALQTFDGVVASPQGRVYRGVLYPEESGTQALLSDATTAATPEFLNFGSHFKPGRLDYWTGAWLVYPASSEKYRPPLLDDLIKQPASKRYHQADEEIVLHKTAGYLLTSLTVPAAKCTERTTPFAPLHAGLPGYQQHLWQATLGAGCHVFFNHPGSSYDECKSRPGYWYGNGVCPRLRQREGVLQAIFDIPNGAQNPGQQQAASDRAYPLGLASNPCDLHPIPFTHAHWPADAFDHHEHHGNWLFGGKNSGYICLWCSEPLKPHDDVLTGREFRAWGCRSAWVAVCSDITEHGSFDLFKEYCLSLVPRFDSTTLTLSMKGEEPLCWK